MAMSRKSAIAVIAHFERAHSGYEWRGAGHPNDEEYWVERYTNARERLIQHLMGHVAPKHPTTIIRDLLKHAVFDRERNDECIAAVDAAEKWLAQQGED